MDLSDVRNPDLICLCQIKLLAQRVIGDQGGLAAIATRPMLLADLGFDTG